MPKKREDDKENPEIEKTDAELRQNADEIETLKSEIAAKEAEYAELKNNYLRLAADFDNYKKRSNEFNAALRESVTAGIIEEFIPLADNYELALKYLDEKSGAGVRMIYKRLTDTFAKFGVKEMEAKGEPFDPARHEAAEIAETEDAESGTVAEVLQKGYTMGGKVLRCAMVKVAK
ncbi:MAG: nucleotide exchange factor GrpE [Clostridiales bacterium]|jgi:molecular chaperone GrpE|nr:nucleotide exchange factor GrpE [Clostridiales bacterium]